ncbi:hypothetical protein [Limosilactobacillus vaginalis]|uniref:hypothetical protein n=1 Tax=Limosilactobacillus vaginalis TaxID=1633 RepID=UPI00242D9067|nr:hypothetical protein [Limosilactobacillus vaginalis]MCI6852599.1 hypothetical protein [Limosilactobacillus vaginalis]
MALTADDLVKIFTGMDLGAEKIQENFGELLQENIGQDNQLSTLNNQLSTLNNQTFKISNFIGKDNADLTKVETGAHPFGFWDNSKTPNNGTWPKQLTNVAAWGWLLCFGGPDLSNITQLQLLYSTGSYIFMRIHAGGGWEDWTVITNHYENNVSA